MSTSNENNNNSNNIFMKNQLKTMLNGYIESNRDLPRKTTTLQVNPEVAQEFYMNCQRLGLAKYRQGANRVVEAFMSIMIDLYKDDAKQMVLMYKPTIKQTVNITEKIEVRLVKDELKTIIKGMQRKDAPQEHLRTLNQRLRKTLQKAVKIQDRVHDPEMESLLVIADKNLS